MQKHASRSGPELNGWRHRGNDALRGLAILSVVVTHTTAEWAAFPAGHPLAAPYRAFRPALEVWIPWFLIVSGYYLGRENVDSWASYGSFLSRRVKRIVPPYLLWATILFALGVAGGTWQVSDYAVGIVNGRFAYPYYFVSVLIKLYLAYPFVAWVMSTPASAILSLVGAGAVWFYGCLPDDQLGLRAVFPAELLFRRTVHAEWLIFFMLGIFLQLRSRRVHQPSKAPGAVLWMAGAALVAAVAIVDLVGYGRFLPGHTVGILGVLVFLAMNTGVGARFAARGRLLPELGERSFTIYLLHEPWLQWTKNLLGNAVTERPLLVQIPLLGVALGVPLALRWVAGALLGSRAKWVTG